MNARSEVPGVNRLSGEARGLIAVAAQTTISIGGFFVAKEALATLPPGPLVLLRSLGAALLLGIVLWAGTAAGQDAREDARWKRGDLWRLLGLGFLGVPMNQALFLFGLSFTDPAHAALLYAMTPAVVLLIGVLRGTESLDRARAAGIALALAGVAVLLAPKALASGGAGAEPARNALLGDLLIFAAMISWAAYTAFARDVVSRLGPVRATTGALAFGALLYLPLGLFTARSVDLTAVSLTGWLGLAWLVVLGSVVSYLCWYYALRRLEPSRVAIFSNMQPVGTVAIAWGAYGTPLGATFLAGGALVLAGVVLAQRSALRAPRD